MVAKASTMLELGTKAPDFELPDVNGNMVKLSDFKDHSGFLIIFMCNHCPFVKHIIDPLVNLMNQYQQMNVAVVAVNSNDINNFPEDSPQKMKSLSEEKNFTFPYLYDESQIVAKAYRAACTPDFFLFDSDLRLFYRGQLDDSRPGNGIEVTGKDLTAAIESLLAGQELPEGQKPSMGCNIKWKKGNEPEYF